MNEPNRLAPELLPWSEQLRRFPEDLALGLGTMMRQLHAALAGMGSSLGAGSEPDGISGVTQRERFERLLVSQWLLASEVPDEFLRRAAMHELLFLESAKREPKASRRCLFVVDAGPSQLGTPRLAHVAMLLVLERRALAARARLEWLVVQHPQQRHESCDENDLLAMLAARSHRAPIASDLAEAWERLAPKPDGDEVVWMGGQRFCQLAAGFKGRRLQITDPCLPEANELRVEVSSAHYRHALSLRLPAPEICTRLIRRPFARVVPLPRAIAQADGAFQFSACGRRILLRDGFRVMAHLPTHDPTYRPKETIVTVGSRLLGAGWYRHDTLLLIQKAGEFFVTHGGQSYAVHFAQRQFVLPPEDQATCEVIALGKRTLRLGITDAQGTLFVGSRIGAEPIVLKPLLDRVILLRYRRGCVGYARAAFPGAVEVGNLGSDWVPGGSQTIRCSATGRVVSGFDRVCQIGAFAIQVAVQESCAGSSSRALGGVWFMVVGAVAKPTEIPVEPTDEVVACVPLRLFEKTDTAQRTRPSDWGLLIHSHDDDCLYLVTKLDRRQLRSSTKPDSTIAWDEHAGRMLYRDTNGCVQVLDVGGGHAPIALPSTRRGTS